MNQLQQEQYTGKGGIYQQLTLPISENILIEEHEPVYVANAQLEELDYRKRYQAYMEPLEHEDGFLCAGGRKLLFTHSSSKKENGFVTTTDYYRCKDCSGCELRSKCFKSSDGVKNKEIRMCTESAEHRKIAFENLLSERGALLRINRSIQVEGAFGVLKSNRKFKRFLMRGKTNISTELFLFCLAFDLQKFFSKLQRGKRNSHLFPLKKE